MNYLPKVSSKSFLIKFLANGVLKEFISNVSVFSKANSAKLEMFIVFIFIPIISSFTILSSHGIGATPPKAILPFRIVLFLTSKVPPIFTNTKSQVPYS